MTTKKSCLQFLLSFWIYFKYWVTIAAIILGLYLFPQFHVPFQDCLYVFNVITCVILRLRYLHWPWTLSAYHWWFENWHIWRHTAVTVTRVFIQWRQTAAQRFCLWVFYKGCKLYNYTQNKELPYLISISFPISIFLIYCRKMV